MKNIQRCKTNNQSIALSRNFLDALIFIFRFLFCEPENKPAKPYVFISPALERRAKLEKAVAAFELKKLGGAR